MLTQKTNLKFVLSFESETDRETPLQAHIDTKSKKIVNISILLNLYFNLQMRYTIQVIL